MPVIPSGAPARARQIGATAAVTAVACTVAMLFAPAAAGAAPGSSASPHAGTITVVDQWESDHDADGVVDSRETQTSVYDSAGRALSSVIESDSDADGVTDFRVVQTTSYGERDELTRTVIEVYDGPDPFLDSSFTTDYTWGKKGALVLATHSTDSDGDGDIDEVSTEEMTTTKKPAATTFTYHGDGDGDGASDDVIVYYSETDKRGNEVLSRSTTDIDDDGTVDQAFEATRTYSNKGAVLTEHTESSGAWSQPDSDTTFSYGAHGLLIGYTTVIEGGEVSTATLTYDDKRRPLSYTLTVDIEGDGVADSVVTSTQTYNADGTISTVVEESVEDASGPNPSIDRTTWSISYDDQGRAVSTTVDTDLGADGTLDRSESASSTFDAEGLLIAETSETDDNADGIVDSSVHTTHTYEDGQLVATTVEYDSDGDGVIDARDTHTLTIS